MDIEVRLLTTSEVLALTGYKSRTTLWRRVKAGKFPAPVALSETAVRWNSLHIQDYIAALPAQRYGHIIEDPEAAEAVDAGSRNSRPECGQ